MAYAAIFTVIVFWGSAAAVGRHLGDAGTPLDLSLWRLALGFGLLLVPQLASRLRQRRKRGAAPGKHGAAADAPPALPRPHRLLPIWLAGILGYGAMIWLFFAAAQATLASHLVLIISLAPICTMLLDRLSGGGRGSSPRSYWPAALSLCGVAVMAAPSLAGSGASLAGDAMAVLAMIAFSAYTVLTKRYGAGMTALQLNMHGMSAGLLFLGIMLAITEGRLLPPAFDHRDQWLAIGYLGLGATGLAYLLYAWALGKLPMEQVMPFIFLQPIVGVLLSAIWLGEALTANVVLGMCGIVGGLVWNYYYSRKPSIVADSARRQSL